METNKTLANSLLEGIKGEGEPVIFSSEDIERDRIHYTRFFEESIRKERRRSAMAREAVSRIYLD